MKILIDKDFTIAQRNVIDKCLHDAKTKLNLDGKIIKLEIKNSGRLKTSAGNATTSLNKKYGISSLSAQTIGSPSLSIRKQSPFIYPPSKFQFYWLLGIQSSLLSIT